MNRKIVLASSSPRRRDILASLGVKFTIDKPHFEEDLTLALTPLAMVERFALGKAQEVAQRHNNSLILGSDVVVSHGGKIFGKPKNQAEAKEMLKTLKRTTHEIYHGFCLIDTSQNKTIIKTSIFKVELADMSDDEIDWYIASGEPLDKAGAYAIQGLGAMFIKRISGDYHAAVGLSPRLFYEALEEIGIRPIFNLDYV